MKSTSELLAIAKARNGDASDYRLAQLLGVSQQVISTYRTRGSIPSAPIAARLGELCGLDPALVVCWAELERAKDDDTRQTWNLLLSRVRPAPTRRKTH